MKSQITKSQITAALLVLVGYVFYHQMGVRIDAALREVDSEAAARFRTITWEIAGARSRALEVEPNTRRQLGADVVVRREITLGGRPIELWVNHYTNAQKGATHSAEVCFSLVEWQKISSHAARGDRPEAVPVNIERYTRKGKDLLVASTFLVGAHAYATQPEAKLGLSMNPGSALVFAMAVLPVSGDDARAEAAMQQLVQTVAQRVRHAWSKPTGE